MTDQPGTPIQVVYLSGTTEQVFVRRIRETLFPQYAAHLTGKYETGEVELVTEKPAGWADYLSDQSFDAVLAASRTLNLQRVFSWARRKSELRAKHSADLEHVAAHLRLTATGEN